MVNYIWMLSKKVNLKTSINWLIVFTGQKKKKKISGDLIIQQPVGDSAGCGSPDKQTATLS